MSFEVTPTEHGAIMRLKFPSVNDEVADIDGGWNQTRRVTLLMNGDTERNDTVKRGLSKEDGLAVLTGFTTRCDSKVHKHIYMWIP